MSQKALNGSDEAKALEADLRRLREQVHSLQRQDPHGFLSLTGHRHAIEAIEREIATLKQRTGYERD